MTKLQALALLTFCWRPSDSDCFAFQSSYSTSSGILRKVVTCTTLTKAHQGGHDIVSNDHNVISRRSVLSIGIAALPILTFIPHPASAVVEGVTQTPVRVESWPGIGSLEPLWEFKLSLDAIAVGVRDAKNWSYIQKRLAKFFGGFIVNEKNFYLGVGVQYMNEIKYDSGELPNYVLKDKEARFEALENTMKNLESLKIALADNNRSNIVEDLAQAAQSSLQSFLALIPDQDIKAVDELFTNVRKADTNGDGRLSDDELIFLSPNEQEIWKRRIDTFGYN